MPISIKPRRPISIQAYVVALLLVAVLFVMGMYGHQIDEALPSWFRFQLTDRNYLGWHRWCPLSAGEAIYGVLLFLAIAWAAYLYIDPIYHAFHGNLRRRQAFVSGIAAALALATCAPLVGGYAIYADHLMVLDPFRDVRPRRVVIDDIDRVEIGCHERITAGRFSSNWKVPSYRIVLRDGRVVSLLDLADGMYDDDQLMRAILAFDTQVRAHRIPKRLRKNLFGVEMGGNGYCYPRMESHYDQSLIPAIRQTFESD
ncbi:MAG TPA: hypothetical protein VG839_09720 [Asticcacaulis sp.]|nr:hypothetical protein [Asticcacaulis sp.]